MSSEWGEMDDDQRKEFVRNWRAWRERAWQASQYARGIEREERRVLFAIIDRIRLGDSANANQLIATISAADIARLLGIYDTTVSRIRQRLRTKGVLVGSSTTGGRKVPATDVISLAWITTAEAEIKARPQLAHQKKPSRSYSRVLRENTAQATAGFPGNMEVQNTAATDPKPCSYGPKTLLLDDKNPAPARADPLKTNLSPSKDSNCHQPRAPGSAPAVTDPPVSIVWPDHLSSVTSRRIAVERVRRFLARIAFRRRLSPAEGAVIEELIRRQCPIVHIERALGDEMALKPGDPLDLQRLVDRAVRYQGAASAKRQRNLRQHLRVVK
jgi:hypothetical protein